MICVLVLYFRITLFFFWLAYCIYECKSSPRTLLNTYMYTECYIWIQARVPSSL